MKFLKQLFCKHDEFRIIPVIEETVRDYNTYAELGIFNKIECLCTKCNRTETINIPILLNTQTPEPLLNAIAASLISNKLGGLPKIKVMRQ